MLNVSDADSYIGDLKSKQERTQVETLARGLTLLNGFSSHGNGLTLTELAEAAGLSKSTALRMLDTFEQLGYVYRLEKKYFVGAACFTLGSLYEFNADLRNLAVPIMRDLMKEINEVVQLGVLQDSLVLYLERLEPDRNVAVIVSRPGSKLPAYSTALGKAILSCMKQTEINLYLEEVELEPLTAGTITNRRDFLSDLQQTLDRGYAIDNCEYDSEIYCIAAPISDKGGEVVAALSVSAPKFRMRTRTTSKVSELVRNSATQVSASLIDRVSESRNTDW